MNAHPTPLKFLMPGWFSVVMGLVGLALAWHSATPAMGDAAAGVSLVLGGLAALVFVVVLVLSVVRFNRYPEAVAEDLRHPVRHAFVAAFPVSMLLLATLAVALGGTGLGWSVLWWAGSVGQFGVTVWVLKRWLVATPVQAGGTPPPFWPVVTPVLFIPVVGNVLAPLAGGALGAGLWALAQFGVGLMLWPVVIALLLARRAAMGPLPDRLLPAWFITLAPPSVVGLVALQKQLPVEAIAMVWGVGFFFLLWAGSVAKQAVSQPFALPFWGLSFPLAAFTSLTLKLSVLAQAPVLQLMGLLLLALVSVVVVGLVLGTYKGLRNGSLLAPEPVAAIVPVQA